MRFPSPKGTRSVVASLLDKNENSLRQRLREWYRGKEEKKGDKRQEIEVKTCFAPLTRWVLSWWPPDEKRIAIGLDATTLADRFSALRLPLGDNFSDQYSLSRLRDLNCMGRLAR